MATNTAKDWVRDSLLHKANELVQQAEALGYVLTVERIPQQPLAMGNHTPKVTVYQKR